MSSGLHHMHLRKRATQKLVCEPYPSRSPAMRLLDRFMLIIAFLAPIALLPQVLRVFQDGDIGGLSMITWLLLAIHNGFWVFYGAVHRDWPLIISNALVAILDLAIVVGILIYA